MRAGYALQAAGASPRLDDFLRLTRVLPGSLRARIELERQGPLRPAFDRHALPAALAADLRVRFREVIRRTYRQTLGRMTPSISEISDTPRRSSGLTSTRPGARSPQKPHVPGARCSRRGWT